MTQELPSDPTNISPGDARELWEKKMQDVRDLRHRLMEVAAVSGEEEFLTRMSDEIARAVFEETGVQKSELRKYAVFHAIFHSTIDYQNYPIFDLPGDAIYRAFVSFYINEFGRLSL